MTQTKYNLRPVTNLDVFASFLRTFDEVGPVSVLAYDIGDGKHELYAQVHITDKITAELYDDSQEIAFMSEGKDLFKVSWNEETERLLCELKGKSAMDLLTTMATHIVRD